ncbi:MAG: hypothetical protein ACP5TY_03650 [Thermodesulforhabdaceae bacterium]|jgi:hypothetical protein
MEKGRQTNPLKVPSPITPFLPKTKKPWAGTHGFFRLDSVFSANHRATEQHLPWVPEPGPSGIKGGATTDLLSSREQKIRETALFGRQLRFDEIARDDIFCSVRSSSASLLVV